jgi:hypothetical protein
VVAPRLLTTTLMTAARLVIGAILVVMVLVGGGMWNDDTDVTRAFPRDGATTTVWDARDDERLDRSGGAFIIDRYGNQIEEAVGDYRVDPRGDIFERHSPATAVARLPAPSS